MKTLIPIIILLFLISCSDKKIVKEISQKEKYSFDNILSYNNEDTLFIKSRFADCGEWGGHEELIKIYRSERKIKLVYIKHKVKNRRDTDNMGSLIQTKDTTENFALTNSKQISVMNYKNNLMKLKFIDPEFGNSGNFFSIEDSRGELKFSQYGNNTHLLNNYNILMTDLGFSKVIVESE